MVKLIGQTGRSDFDCFIYCQLMNLLCILIERGSEPVSDSINVTNSLIINVFFH